MKGVYRCILSVIIPTTLVCVPFLSYHPYLLMQFLILVCVTYSKLNSMGSEQKYEYQLYY